MAQVPRGQLTTLNDFRRILDAIAQGDILPSGGYDRLRRELLADRELSACLPDWLATTRTENEFRTLLAGHRADSLGFISSELEPALSYLEEQEFNADQPPSTQLISRPLSVDRSATPARSRTNDTDAMSATPPEASLTVSSLHVGVAAEAGPLYRDGHYAPSVFQGFKAVEVRLRELSGLDLSGRALAAQALSGEPPPVAVSRHQGRTGDDEQEGLRFIFMGAFQGLRNPGGHELGTMDGQEALEQLAVASMLMRWLDTGRAGNAAPTMPEHRKRGARPPRETALDRPSAPLPEPAPSPRLVVLRELRDMAHRQAREITILDLQINSLAEASGFTEDLLQDALVDLLSEGLVEPFAATLGQSAEQGACRITGDGMRQLASQERSGRDSA